MVDSFVLNPSPSYPTYMPILQRAIELWYHVPACTTPVLKLMAELVHNRYTNMHTPLALIFRPSASLIPEGERIMATGTNMYNFDVALMRKYKICNATRTLTLLPRPLTPDFQPFVGINTNFLNKCLPDYQDKNIFLSISNNNITFLCNTNAKTENMPC